MNMWIYKCLIWTLIHLTTLSHNRCTGCLYPQNLQNSSWYDNSRGVLVFTEGEMSGFTILSYASTVSDWECFSIIDSLLISKGKTTVYLFGSDHDVYLCMDMTEVTSASYYYYLSHDEEPNANNERVHVIPTGTNITDSRALCQTTSPTTREQYNVMVKQGSESVARQWCPSEILGSYHYTYSSASGSSCGVDSEWDVCSNRTTMTFNFTRCSTTVAFTDLEVFCVASLTSSNVLYLTVFNNGTVDSVNFYRFTCMALSLSGTTVSVSLQKLKCDAGQTPTVLPTGGGLAVLTPYYTCPFTDNEESTASASLIGAIVAVCLLVFLIVLVLIIYMKLKKKNEISPESQRGLGAYFVREFTFERLTRKLTAENEHHPEVCSSVSTLNSDINDTEDITCVDSAPASKPKK